MIKHRFLRNKKLATVEGVVHFDKNGLNDTLEDKTEVKLAKALSDITLVHEVKPVKKAKPVKEVKKVAPSKNSPVKEAKPKSSKAPAKKKVVSKAKHKAAQGAKKAAK